MIILSLLACIACNNEVDNSSSNIIEGITKDTLKSEEDSILDTAILHELTLDDIISIVYIPKETFILDNIEHQIISKCIRYASKEDTVFSVLELQLKNLQDSTSKLLKKIDDFSETIFTAKKQQLKDFMKNKNLLSFNDFWNDKTNNPSLYIYEQGFKKVYIENLYKEDKLIGFGIASELLPSAPASLYWEFALIKNSKLKFTPQGYFGEFIKENDKVIIKDEIVRSYNVEGEYDFEVKNYFEMTNHNHIFNYVIPLHVDFETHEILTQFGTRYFLGIDERFMLLDIHHSNKKYVINNHGETIEYYTMPILYEDEYYQDPIEDYFESITLQPDAHIELCELWIPYDPEYLEEDFINIAPQQDFVLRIKINGKYVWIKDNEEFNKLGFFEFG